ncbi:hypothetical protein ACLKA6_012213 [Drosophila palustris]
MSVIFTGPTSTQVLEHLQCDHVSAVLEHGEALTPSHLLIDGSLIAPPVVGTPDQGLSCLKRWRLVSSLKRMFWQSWSREYVLGLQTRAKWHQQQQNIAVGDLVVIAEDNMPSQ